MSTTKRYRFHWRGNRAPQEGEGWSVADAFTRLGYGRGALGALDYWQDITDEDEAANELDRLAELAFGPLPGRPEVYGTEVQS